MFTFSEAGIETKLHINENDDNQFGAEISEKRRIDDEEVCLLEIRNIKFCAKFAERIQIEFKEYPCGDTYFHFISKVLIFSDNEFKDK